jgi:succinoglycan biosynthesis transport protein ExoP
MLTFPTTDLKSSSTDQAIAISSATSVRNIALPMLMNGWRLAKRWRLVIAGILLTSFLMCGLVTSLMTSQYTATAMIAISRQQDKIVEGQDVTPENDMADPEFYQTQYSLLVARSLAEHVAADLKLDSDADYFAKMHLKDPDGGLASTFFSKPDPVAQAEGRKRLIINTLLKHIRVNPIRGSRLVEVGFSSPDPKLSMQIANAWIDHFIESNLARRFDATSYARTFLAKRLEEVRQRLEGSERQLVLYARQQRIISLPASGGASDRADRPIVADNLATLNASLSEATVDRIKAQGQVAASSSAQQGDSPAALQNGTLSALRQKRVEVAGDLAQMLVQFEPGYPQARALQQQLDVLDRSIDEEIHRVQQGANETLTETRHREHMLHKQVEGVKNDILDLRSRSIQYSIYQRDVDTSRAIYDALLQRYKEIGVAGGIGSNNVAIVDRAQIPVDRSSPRIALNLAIALLMGLIGSAATIFVLDQIDEAIQDPAELGRLISLPILGIVPDAGGESPLMLLRDRRSFQSEAYLSIQTSLQFSSDHGVPKTIAVTSTRSAEGKSTFSYALALVLSRTGRRVALVDCDMRHPSIQPMLGVPNGRGTSNFLAGDDDLPGMILNDPMSEIAVLPAGGTPPNAAELLTGPRLPLLFERLEELYDHVIIDCPPVLGLADAPLIAGRTEGVIYLVRARYARLRVVREALLRLTHANAHVIGTVFTMYDAKRSDYYNYGYGEAPETAPLQV